ncbi:HAD family hydrolase [Actinacidiphila yeochonensis]|uniref:HAD family hydrolase n=1 Tax=Actinacidiphila yeochonensis TaxID=89050 RepID=UPI000A7CFC4F|nr:HAD family hydrolase [Actinacidiphila yeochonensis]
MDTTSEGRTGLSGVMFDFSGTLFRIEPARQWLAAALAEAGVTAEPDEVAHYAGLLEAAGAQPGGGEPRALPAHLAERWEARDLTDRRHREAYTALSRLVDLPWDVHDALYERHMAPEAWQPYPDTARALKELEERNIPVAVVSNIGWDLRPVFEAHGLKGGVREFVLSFEHEVQKPDPRIFGIALAALGTAARDTAMVGDNARADGGATALGCPFLLVEPLRVEERPDALLGVLDLPPVSGHGS